MSIDIQIQTRSIPRRARRIREPGMVDFAVQWVCGGVAGVTLGLAILRMIDAVPPGFRPVVEFFESQLF